VLALNQKKFPDPSQPMAFRPPVMNWNPVMDPVTTDPDGDVSVKASEFTP